MSYTQRHTLDVRITLVFVDLFALTGLFQIPSVTWVLA